MTHIHLIGTNHISSDSIRKIQKTFAELDPDIVLIELDQRRLAGLLQGVPASRNPLLIRQIGLKGYMFALIGSYLQKKLGNLVDVNPGADMLEAFKLAKENKKKIGLIDRDIVITLRRFSKAMPFKEKFQLVKDMFSRKRIKINISKVPSQETIDQLLGMMKEKYPTTFKVLVTERNEHMARNILRIASNNKEAKILVVVGAGHEREITELMKNYLKTASKA